MSCPQCGAKASSEARFCAACGAFLTASLATSIVTAPTPSEATPPHLKSPEAERRQLTVLLCDVASSIELSSDIELESYLEIIQAYQTTCERVIQNLNGYIAQHFGGGVLAYFGYPSAHEDDAHRAIRAGLEIIESLKPLSHRLEQDLGVRPAV